MQNMTVFSDYICPFCFIGKQRIDRLAVQFPLQPVWKGFEIHPEVPPEGIPISRFMPGIIANLEANVRRLADEIGLEIRMPQKLSNSHLALLGGEVTREAGRFEEYHQAVFAAYFQQGKDIADLEILAEIAQASGMDDANFKKAIEEEKYADSLNASLREARFLGLTGVPSVLFADKNIVVGAQAYEIFEAAAEKSLKASA